MDCGFERPQATVVVKKSHNHAIEPTYKRAFARCLVPSSFHSSAAAHRGRSASRILVRSGNTTWGNADQVSAIDEQIPLSVLVDEADVVFLRCRSRWVETVRLSERSVSSMAWRGLGSTRAEVHQTRSTFPHACPRFLTPDLGL